MFVSMVSTFLVICYDNFVLQPIKIRRLAITLKDSLLLVQPMRNMLELTRERR